MGGNKKSTPKAIQKSLTIAGTATAFTLRLRLHYKAARAAGVRAQCSTADRVRVRMKFGERVRQEGGRFIMTNGNTRQEGGDDDIARLALAMHDNSYFFLSRRGLAIRFCRDFNGSGDQLLEITRENGQKPHLIRVYFTPTHRGDDSFLYEADLIKDHGKDYEPTINQGKHRFVARSAGLNIDWGSEEVQHWRYDVERLSKTPDTLAGWVEADLQMLVRCRQGYTCFHKTILTNSDLAAYVTANVSLEELKARLKCSKCGKRQPLVRVF